jgi:indolepyruvate ferredoxin oxidoreductase alpha subunit
MKLMAEMLLRREPQSEIVMGNTALVRAMIESGTRVVSSYPGSPTPEIADAIASMAREQRPFYFEFSTNEKVATEVACGAALNGHLATVFFKSVGLNVAADSFVQLNHLGMPGGLVVVLGDDPGANSSQNEQDNRHLARLSYTPVLEPASPTEVYRFYKAAAMVARERRMAVVMRLTTHVCHAKERVAFDGWTPVALDPTPRFDGSAGSLIPLTSAALVMKRAALLRLAGIPEHPALVGLNPLVDHGNRQRGVITAGLPFLSLMDVLSPLTIKPDILKLGLIHPLPRHAVLEFLANHREVLVLEELDDVLEREIKALAFDEGLALKIHGKADVESWIGELTPERTAVELRKTWPDLLPAAAGPDEAPPVVVPDRPPQMCPGCGHRSAFHAIGQALDASDITVADIGCHTLGYLPPYQTGKVLLCMGASTGVGAGLSLFNTTRRVVAFLGDSTFYHAGLPGIINALFNHHRLTLVLMENGTTAMTGHQDHAGSGRNFNQPTERIPVRRLLEGLGVQHIFEVDTYQQAKLTELMKQALAVEGFSVVIARHPCMLKFTREARRKSGYRPRRVSIDAQRCRRIHTCVAQFACPTFVRHADGSVTVNPDLCIGDGSCVQCCAAGAITQPAPVSG